MEWQETYSIGIDKFDDHHRHLFDLLNKAHDSCLKGCQTDIFGEIINELAEYVHYHFTAEEQFMEENSYPHLATHREEHLKFSQKIAESHKMLSSCNGVGSIEMIELTSFLMEWLFHHILDVDMRYAKIIQGEK
ncbi:MAG: bacteriohemerythrin [Desulfuromonadaceae bacterium]|nr:bacteriohemerythrin [Desulfuromonadaceae bacterium]MDD2856358.1 bacteriohemerythrin [Desulfuromonadaceae bacterium]